MTVRGATLRERASLLTLNDVACELRCSRRTVERLVERGQLPHVRVGTLVRVHPEDLRAYISGRHQEAAPVRLSPSAAGLPQIRRSRASARLSFLDELQEVER